jgi:hypothetical protein
LRWWFLRDVARNGDTDFREDLIAARASELADGLGNLINRTIALVARNRPAGPRWPSCSTLATSSRANSRRSFRSRPRESPRRSPNSTCSKGGRCFGNSRQLPSSGPKS